MLRGVTLPPVELIQVGDTYFVVDGHHRISAARALKVDHIDATVTVWEVAK
jgi:ParB-like chromosome segregation protein Spo0J